MEAVPGVERMISESGQLRRIGYLRFPIEELSANGEVLAHLSRDSSLRIFFGAGRRVRLADGTEWRIKATTLGRHIVPIVRSEAGTIAISGPLHAERSYGINGKGSGYTLIPLGRSGLHRGHWSILRHESQIATIDERNRAIETDEPVPIAAVLLAFTLITHGIPGEADLMPARD